jgi:hypothetical protein
MGAVRIRGVSGSRTKTKKRWKEGEEGTRKRTEQSRGDDCCLKVILAATDVCVWNPVAGKGISLYRPMRSYAWAPVAQTGFNPFNPNLISSKNLKVRIFLEHCGERDRREDTLEGQESRRDMYIRGWGSAWERPFPDPLLPLSHGTRRQLPAQIKGQADESSIDWS